MKKRLFVLSSFSIFLVLAVAGPALAHVTVSPGEVPAGEAASFTVSVPSELEVPTTEVRVEIPEGFEVASVGEAPGWQTEEEEEAGRVSAITWSGGEIPAEGSEDFVFEATAPDEAGEFPFQAIQTYEDGTVVEWAGPEDSNEPASIVAVAASGDSGHDGHDHGDSEAVSEPLPDSGGAAYILLGGGLAAMLLGAAVLRRRT